MNQKTRLMTVIGALFTLLVIMVFVTSGNNNSNTVTKSTSITHNVAEASDGAQDDAVEVIQVAKKQPPRIFNRRFMPVKRSTTKKIRSKYFLDDVGNWQDAPLILKRK